MPYISESRYAELMRMEQAVSDVCSHTDAWIGLLEKHVASLPDDRQEGSKEANKSYAQHELRAMRRDLGALTRIAHDAP